MAQPTKTAARAAESIFRNRQKEQQLETAGMMRWLLTYADMITLMLALFIILFAMSNISRVKVEKFAKLVSGGFNNTWSINQPPNGGTNDTRSFDSSSSIPSIDRQIQRFVQSHRLQNQVEVRMEQRGLVITLLSDKSFYNSGSAQLRPATAKIVDAITHVLDKSTARIRVEGNTDNVPISTAKYPSNWELSTARAVNVVRRMVERDGLNPVRVSAAGYGQYRPRTANRTAAERQENRRVDIVLLTGPPASGKGL